MTASRWSTIERLCHEALARPAEDRVAFLSTACGGDEELRHEVESLLAHDGDASFLSVPAVLFGDGPAIRMGQTLGSYVVSARLGEGGMGEVYRARDTKLGRDVAIKVLPSIFTSDPERLARFEREARLLAALNHPHIGAIYGLEESDGIRGLVLELVEGSTLAERVARPGGGARQGSAGTGLSVRPMPLDEALAIARQIADALEAAHEKGIVHRDLKPANIKITPAGVVKVLDFGLAKAMVGDGSGPDLSQSPTITAGGTKDGVILGTAAYMSPGQARGKPVDKRADVWAFGCVLYEMLTGRLAFPGDTLSDTIVSILQAEPDWRALPETTPAGIRRLLRRCLEKDPTRRLRDIGDARLDIDEALTVPAQSQVVEAPSISGKEPRPSHPWREHAAWIAAAASVAMVLFVFLHPVSAPASSGAVRFPILPADGTSFTGQVANTVTVPQLEVSPDGRAIVFAAAAPGARPTLWLRPLDSVTAHALPDTEGAEAPFWSRDNRWIGFFADGKLKKIAVAGGPSQVIADVPDSRPASWGPDDTILFSTGNTGILRVPSSGGVVTPITKLDVSRQDGSHRFPQLLPDGTHFLFTVRSRLADRAGVYAGSVDGKTKQLPIRGQSFRGQTTARYASGYVFYLDGDTLMGQAFDTKRLELSGQAFVVASGVGRSSMGSGSYSLSESGTLAFAGSLSRPSRLTWFDRAGRPSGSVGPVGDYPDFRLSPDQTRLAASLADAKTGFPDIWLTDLTRGNPAPFTFGPGINAGAAWSPNNASILFRTTRYGGLPEFYRKSAGGGGQDEPVLSQKVELAAGILSGNISLTDWSADGEWALFSAETSSDFDLWIVPLTGAQTPRIFLSAPRDQWHGNFSPNGKLVAYTSSESGRNEIHVQTFPLSDQNWTISTDGGYEPRWRADGRELYFLSADQKLMAVPVGPEPSFGVPMPLFQTHVGAGVSPQRTHYVPSGDGQRFLISTPVALQAATAITVVLNATAGFKK